VHRLGAHLKSRRHRMILVVAGRIRNRSRSGLRHGVRPEAALPAGLVLVDHAGVGCIPVADPVTGAVQVLRVAHNRNQQFVQG